VTWSERRSIEIQTKSIRKEKGPRPEPEIRGEFEISWQKRIAAAHRMTSGGGGISVEKLSYFTRANSQP
jgi:hypothetical protein